MVVKIFLKKIYARTNSYSSNELFSLEGWKCLKMVARRAWNANCLVEAAGYHNLEKMITQIS